MKLELKHLAPYLPYGLKCMVDKETVLLIGLDTEVEYWIIWKKLAASNQGCSYPSKNFKLLLRPLSDLTKEIEHNGEKFVPSLNEDSELRQFTFSSFNSIKTYYADFEKLFEWHFDVFGLIEAGLAIDINTLHEKEGIKK